MKKLTPRFKVWLIRRAANQAKRRSPKNRSRRELVTAWTGDEFFKAYSERGASATPEILCLSENFGETSLFLEKLRRKMLSRSHKNQAWVRYPKSGRGKPTVPGYYDFSLIKKIGIGAALVLAAEYARASRLVGQNPTIVNIDTWEPSVFRTLFEIGFFETVGIQDTNIAKILQYSEDTMTLKFFSGVREKTSEADLALAKLLEYAMPGQPASDDIMIPIVSAISEAMINVARHAYPEDHSFRFRHVERWWITGTASKLNRNITIAIYDQGATIPVTYTKHFWSDRLAEFLGVSDDSRPFATDGKTIQAAAKFGSTSTNQPERGKGLPQMKEAVELCGDGSLRILSRGGEYLYTSDGQEKVFSHPISIGGTLIEWSINLPEDQYANA